MNKKLLLALDLDGTLLNSALEISAATKKRLREFQELGHVVTIATGRPLQGALRYALELNLKIPLILNNGALVAETDGREHAFYPVDIQVSQDFVRHCSAHSIPCSIFVGEDIYMLTPCPLADQLHRKYDQIAPKLVENPLEIVKLGVSNFVVTLEPELVAATYAQLQTQFGSRLQVVRSGRHFIDIFQPGVSKGHALLDLASSLRIESKNVIAVGDNHNDLEMLKLAGLGVAMAGADDLVKSAADYVTMGNDEDGIAALVEAILTKGHLNLASS